MVTQLLAAGSLMALCVTIHAGGVAWSLQKLRPHVAAASGFWSETRVFILAAVLVVLLHLVEICVWASFYVWSDAFPDWKTAAYFSAVTYTTTGYGDLVLPDAWRLVGGIEALTGILMCGWSTAFFIALVGRVQRSRVGEP
jgi:hypothetical protein